MDQETNGLYVSQIFEDGLILTANDMNNIITGIDENAKKIENLDALTTDINSIEATIDNIESNINGLLNRVPPTPSEEGIYWLAALQPSNVYLWINETPVSMYTDPEDDGNIVITNSGTEPSEELKK